MKHSRRHQLSEFFCRELLYDFAIGLLDPARKMAVEESIKEYPELETEFQSLKQGLAYTKKLSQTRVSPQFVEDVLLNTSFFDKMRKPFKYYKWRVALLGLAVLIGALWLGVIYWQSVATKSDHILWSVDSIKPQQINAD